MRIPRRTKKQYSQLFDDPRALFASCDVTLFPNGYPEIWVKSQDGRKGFKITAGNGPHGLMVTLSTLGIGGPGMTVSGNLAPDYEVFPPKGEEAPELRELSACIYNPDETSQAFKRWYRGQGPHPDEALRRQADVP